MSPASEQGQTSYVYDSGALLALGDRRNATAFRLHQERVLRGRKIVVPAVVAAQVVRKPEGQARLFRVLRGCELIPFTLAHYVPVGRLLAESGTSDVVDAFVALSAVTGGDRTVVISSDVGDIDHLLSCLGVRRTVVPA